MSFFNIKSEVEPLVREHEIFQDNDPRLIANIWMRYLSSPECKHNPHEMTAVEFLGIFSKGELPSVGSITRCRRLLQEKDPDTYGKNKKRKKYAEEVKEEVIVEGNNIEREAFEKHGLNGHAH